MPAASGLRDRKKQLTRARIAESALGLFAERGFEHVSVVEVAAAADVSPATVFNYFPTKEDLIYDSMGSYEESLLAAIRTRSPESGVLDAFRAFALQPRGALVAAEPGAIARLATMARVIADSPALRAREQQLVDHATGALAEIVADEPEYDRHDLRPWVIANALMGVTRAMTHAVQQQAMAGQPGPAISREVLAQGRRAIEVIEHGVAGTA
jgi:AcrR family transcriptional regulator